MYGPLCKKKNNQSRTSSEHFDPPLFRNPYKIMAEAGSSHSLSLNLVNARTSITSLHDHGICHI